MTIIIKSIELIQNDKYEKWRNFQKHKKGINKAFGIIFAILFVILLSSIFYVNINAIDDDANGLPDGSIEDRTDICTWLKDNQNKCTMNCSSSKSNLYEIAITEKFIQRPQCIENKFRLIINSPIFTSNVMTEKWFTINDNITINELILDVTNITQINGNAFVSNSFKTIEYLKLLNVQLHLFQHNTFNGLPNLKVLIIECNKIIPLFERNTLQSVSSTLQFYQISTAFINEIKTFPEQLLSSVTMPALKELILCNNYFPDTVTADSFIGLPNLKLLNLSKTHLELIGEHSFDSICHSIEIIDLTFNNLKALPPKFFENLLPPTNGNPIFYTSHNLWHCDCKLKEFQYYRIHYGDNFNDITKCNTPLMHYGTALELVTLCKSSINDTTIATSSSSSSSTADTTTADTTTTDTTTTAIAPTTSTQESSIKVTTPVSSVATPPIPSTTKISPPINITLSINQYALM